MSLSLSSVFCRRGLAEQFLKSPSSQSPGLYSSNMLVFMALNRAPQNICSKIITAPLLTITRLIGELQCRTHLVSCTTRMQEAHRWPRKGHDVVLVGGVFHRWERPPEKSCQFFPFPPAGKRYAVPCSSCIDNPISNPQVCHRESMHLDIHTSPLWGSEKLNQLLFTVDGVKLEKGDVTCNFRDPIRISQHLKPNPVLCCLPMLPGHR